MKNIVLGLLLAFGIQSQAAEFLVKYKNQQGLMALQNRLQQKNANIQMTDQHERGSYVVVSVKDENEKTELQALENLSGVEYVVPNFELRSFSEIPARFARDSRNLKDQWAMAKVQAERAWQRAGNQGNRNVMVAVIDTGVDYEHQALAPNMIPGFDFADNDEDANDITSRSNPGHGTHCAGVVGATGRIPDGIVGLSPDVRLMPIRFLNEKGSGDLNNGIKAIDFAIEKGAQIISASWGAQVPESTAKPLMEAVKRAADAGVLFVVAAGNSNKNNDKVGFYPANAPYDNVINVAASNKRDGKPSFSNFGRGKVHVSSPGEGIMSTLPGDKYGNLSGTSMATPLVAGLAAFLMAQDAKLTAPQVKALIQTTGVKNSIETACNCRVDAFQAVDHLVSKKPWIFPAAATLAKKDTLQAGVVYMDGSITYSSSNPQVMSVDAQGKVEALRDGMAKVIAQDAAGNKISSLDFVIGTGKGGGGDTNPPNDPGTPGQCPYENPKRCEMACWFNPRLPWCSPK